MLNSNTELINTEIQLSLILNQVSPYRRANLLEQVT